MCYGKTSLGAKGFLWGMTKTKFFRTSLLINELRFIVFLFTKDNSGCRQNCNFTVDAKYSFGSCFMYG